MRTIGDAIAGHGDRVVLGGRVGVEQLGAAKFEARDDDLVRVAVLIRSPGGDYAHFGFDGVDECGRAGGGQARGVRL